MTKNIQKVIAKCLGVPTKRTIGYNLVVVMFILLVLLERPFVMAKKFSILGIIVCKIIMVLLLCIVVYQARREYQEYRNTKQTCESHADLAVLSQPY